MGWGGEAQGRLYDVTKARLKASDWDKLIERDMQDQTASVELSSWHGWMDYLLTFLAV